MKEYKQKPAQAGSAIPTVAQQELLEQDVRRAQQRALGVKVLAEQLLNSIFAQAGNEIDAVRWGAEADTEMREGGEEVTRPIRVKYPMRTNITAFERWLTSFKNHNGTPFFQFPKPQYLHGFIFNEGGRGVTLSILPNAGLPFRLYVAGWVLMLREGRTNHKLNHKFSLSFRHL